jgi:general L-amino acid transport system permease protein
VAAAAPTAQVKPPFWRNVRVLRWAFQAVFLLVVIVFLLYLWGNLTDNLERLGIRTDFRFLRQPAGFAIPDSDFRSSQSVWDAFLVGARNTAVVSILGIVLATILGVLVGVARLSTNWLVRRAAALYVETFRNVPVLIIIIFWWAGILIRLPSLDENELFGLVNLSNRGLVLPWLDRTADLTLFLVVVLLTAVAAALVMRWRTRRTTGCSGGSASPSPASRSRTS